VSPKGQKKQEETKPAGDKPAGKVSSARLSSKVLDGILDSLNRALKQSKGKEESETTVQRLSSEGLSIHIPGVIPSGEEALDLALGRGGLPLSRIILLAGDEGSGKTTMALSFCASVQKMGGIALYIDAEYKLDVAYAKVLGVDTEALAISQPAYLEKAWEVISTCVLSAMKAREESGKPIPILVVLDSLNALPTKAELEGDFEDKHVAAGGRATSSGLRKLVSLISREHVTLLLISQLRSKIGVMFGSGKSTAGGNAPRFYSTIIIEIEPGAGIKEEVDGVNQKAGHHLFVNIVKNGVAAPFKKCVLKLRYGQGFDTQYGLLEAGKVRGIIKEGGAGWYDGMGVKFQGLNGFKAELEENPDLEVKLRKAIREVYGWEK